MDPKTPETGSDQILPIPIPPEVEANIRAKFPGVPERLDKFLDAIKEGTEIGPTQELLDLRRSRLGGNVIPIGAAALKPRLTPQAREASRGRHPSAPKPPEEPLA